MNAYSETSGEPVKHETKSHIPSLPLLAHPSPLPLKHWRFAGYRQYNKNYMHFIKKKKNPDLLPYSQSGKSITSFVTPVFSLMFFALVAFLWPVFWNELVIFTQTQSSSI